MTEINLKLRCIDSGAVTTPIFLGERGENGATAVNVDFSDWVNEYGSGVITLYAIRSSDTVPYPVILSVSGNIATWTITDVDTAEIGIGKAEYVYAVDGNTVKTALFVTRVSSDILGSDTTPPDPYATWLDTLMNLAAETQENAQIATGAAADAQSAKAASENAEEAAEAAQTIAENSASDSEAYAVGTRGGIPVSSGDEAYENNAKYMKEQAGLYTFQADSFSGQSAAWATGSYDGGNTPVPSTEPQHNNNAKYYSEQAEDARDAILSMTATADVDANVGTPSVSVTKTTVSDHINLDFDFHNIKGSKGDTGTAATVSVGSTTTGNPGTNASVTNSGSSSAAVLNFTIPRGATGATGATPSLSIGTVSTLAAGSDATASITGTDEAPVLNLGIPKGADGEVTKASIATAYSTSGTYAVGDYCWYSGQLYRCVTAITSGESWTAAHWTAAKLAEDVTALNSDFNNQVYYSEGSYETLSTTTIDKYYYIADPNIAGKLNYTANNYANTTVVPCRKGDKFKVSWRHMSAVVGIVYANEDCTQYYGTDVPAGTPSAEETDYEVEIEIDCENVIFNGTSGYSTTVKKFIPETVKDKIADIETKLSSYGNVYTVCKDGSGDFSTIQSAVDGTSDGDTILIFPGTYSEQVTMTGKVRHLIGVDKETCIITDDSSDYRTPPLWMGAGSVQNLTIIETHENPDPDLLNGDDTDGKNFNYQRAYCIHVEDYATCHDTDAVTLIENCILKNTKRCCLGMGLYQGHTIIVRNCDLWTGAPDRTADVNRGVIYFHSRQTDQADTTDQKIRLINNTAYSDTSLTLFIGDSARFSNRTSEMDCEFINNMLYSSVDGKADSTVGGNTTPSTNVTYNPDSYGNNIAKLNVT